VPCKKPIKGDRGDVFSEYRLSFDCRGVIQVAKDGKVSLADDKAAFHHQAKWTTAEGKAADYLFGGKGALRASGRFEGEALKLNLQWTSGAGRGAASGKRIDEPVAVHSGKSEWTLKPAKIKVAFGSGEANSVQGFTGIRRSMMPQSLAGCPPLPLVERIEVYRLPTADLAVTAKATPPVEAGGPMTLKVTVKNLGPEPAHGIELNLHLPVQAKIVAPKRHESRQPGLLPLIHAMNDLPSGASADFELVVQNTAQPEGNAPQAEAAILVQVVTDAYDPNPANDEHFDEMLWKAK
jgi:hypothetical protein